MLMWTVLLALAAFPLRPWALDGRAIPPVTAGVIRHAKAGSLHGRLTDEHGAAVPGVQLTIVEVRPDSGASRATTSDSAGRYVLTGLRAGDYRLTARRFGFEAVNVPVSVRDGADQQLDLRMNAAPQRLDTVKVTGTSLTPERYGTSSKMDEFYRRKQEGKGRFFTREDIDDSDANNTATLLGRVPGIRSKREDNGVIYVHIASCVGSTGRVSPGAGDDWGWENVALFVDGSPIGKGSKSAVISTLQPAESEAIEVYKGPGEMPAEAMGDGCAAVYIWTRVAGK